MPNHSRESLVLLGRWFEKVVSTRPRSDDEIARIKGRLTIPVEVESTDLSDRTISVALDVGIHFANALLARVPGLEWDQPLSAKRSSDYGHVVLRGQGKVAFNPFMTMRALAYRISRGGSADLGELFDAWSAQLSKP
jgi:hypothetical protein